MREYRSALADLPGAAAPDLPSVGIVVPVYNEIKHLDQLTADVLAQDYGAIAEIWFVDGQSTDGTYEALQALEAADARVRVISNPKRMPAAAVNLAVERMRTDIVMRLDAHARYQEDVVAQSVRTLLATGAGGVGAIARPAPAKTMIGRAIVAAHRSRIGVGVAKFRREGAEGWADTVWNGCYWRHVVDEVGPLREDLWRAEDNDFNARVRALGYGLYLSPAIVAYYEPRRSLGALWNQYLSNGIGMALALFENRDAVSLRHLAPLLLVSGLILLLVLGLVWPPALLAMLVVLLAYVAALVVGTLLVAKSDKGPHLVFVPLALATLHFSYGLGALWGFALRVPGVGRAGAVSPSSL